MDSRITLINRLRIQLSGYKYVGERVRDGWKGSLSHYAFWCPVHGLVESYPHGHDQRLECPLCVEERAATKVTV